MPHSVVDGRGLDAVPVDGVRGRPFAVGIAVEDHSPGDPDGGPGIVAG